MDLRLKNLSYSSRLTLHACPRKYEIYKLSALPDLDEEEDDRFQSSLTFQFGHSVGAGIQYVLQGMPMEKIIWRTALEWNRDLLEEDVKRNKNFWNVLIAIQKFAVIAKTGIFKDYELVYYKEKPACELSFCILLPGGFLYRGHVDFVLRHRISGAIIVGESKTTASNNINPATYKNSDQAIGYSIVLDVIFGSYSDYKVLYPVYKTKDMEWELFPFMKSPLQRAEWIQSLLYDCQDITRYNENNLFPIRGENCVSKYGRDCSYLQVCGLKREFLTSKITPEEEEKLMKEPEKYQIVLTLEQLIQGQIEKQTA